MVFVEVIKRKYGSFVLSKSFETQKKELLLRLVAYNIDRKIILSIIYLRISPEPYSKTHKNTKQPCPKFKK